MSVFQVSAVAAITVDMRLARPRKTSLKVQRIAQNLIKGKVMNYRCSIERINGDAQQ